MEVTKKCEFVELSMNEVNEIDGGGKGMDALMATAGTLAVSWSPVVACFNPPVAVAMASLGGAAILVAGNVDADIIKY